MKQDAGMDNATALRLRKSLAQEFRDQLSIVAPSNEDEAGLRWFAALKTLIDLFTL